MLVAILNDSSKVSDEDARLMTSAIDMQLRAHVAPGWGRLPPKIYYAKGGLHAAWVPGSSRLHLVDAIPEAPDALGYHTEDADGTIDGRIGCNTILDGGSVLTGHQSVASVLSHEIIELFLDPFVDFWADAADGYSYPLEGCDAVQGDVYPLGGTVVSGSNFVLPSWFDPMGKGPFDHMGKLERPFSISHGGYTVRRKRGTGTTEIFGSRPIWKKSLRGAVRHRTPEQRPA